MSSVETVSSLNAGIVVPVSSPRRYVWSREFDSTLLAAPFLVGLTVAVAALANPRLYPALLLADVWLLGYHHVVATYTRLAFDRGTLAKNRFLAFDLLAIVLVVSVALTLTMGAWIIASLFLYLQWFHYMRQGYGIARMYYRATERGRAGSDHLTNAVVYLVPVYGIAARSASMGDLFLALPVKTIVLPGVLIQALGIAAGLAVCLWSVRVARDIVNRQLDAHYTGFVASHVLVFTLAYVLIPDVNVGWLCINIWHNFQYVLVVWMTNVKRYSRGIEPHARFLSLISQRDRVVGYFGACLAISTAVYFNLNQITTLVLGSGLAATLGIYMGINFHHYIVDAMIWKARRLRAQPA